MLLSPPAPTPPHISALDREATPADALPEGIPPLPGEGHTTRLLATADGIRYFVGQTRDATSTCLTVIPEDRPTQWTTGCGQATDSRQELVRTGVSGVVAAVLIPDNYDPSRLLAEGFSRVHENIYSVSTNRIPGSAG
ncbi:hypothetical protein [Pseudarthrobacter sp. NKDBFgelt]|uniref:hypothetical protein n=1 Tax=Pseudarthrobacter sp. NKDBFgelt TaxID=3384443 RepID=UPI0038D4D405